MFKYTEDNDNDNIFVSNRIYGDEVSINVTLSGSGYKLKLAPDVSATSNSWNYKNSVATLSQSKSEKYSLVNDGKSISYIAGTSTTMATIKGTKSNYEFDFVSDYYSAVAVNPYIIPSRR